MSVEIKSGEKPSPSEEIKKELHDLFSSERGGTAGYQAFMDYRTWEKHHESRLGLIHEISLTSDSHDKIAKRSQLRIKEYVLARIEYDIERKKSKLPGYYFAFARISNLVDSLTDAILDEVVMQGPGNKKGSELRANIKRKEILDELTVDLIMRS